MPFSSMNGVGVVPGAGSEVGPFSSRLPSLGPVSSTVRNRREAKSRRFYRHVFHVPPVSAVTPSN